MNKLRFVLQSLSIAMLLLAATSVAQAQATRTWVSGVGDDVNPCSRTAPCKTFAGAISKTAAGGEISVLDPGGYGAVTITKSITIDGGTGAGWGSILACGTNGVIVNDSLTGAPNTIEVTLRNLSINGCGNTTSPGVNGIRFLSGSTLHVDNVYITGFSSHGIDATTASNGKLTVNNTRISECNGSGIRATTSSGLITATINNVQSQKNGTGVSAEERSRVQITNSVLSDNTNGINVSSATSNAIVVAVGNTISSNSSFGIVAGNTTTTNLSNNSIVNNNNSISLAGGSVRTFGDNVIISNGTNTLPNGGLQSKQ